MNRLKKFKYKTNADGTGILTKITKRYTTVSSKLARKHGENVAQPTIATGSYNMTGRDCEDLKLEIGAPVLISKTNIDYDTIDNMDAIRRERTPRTSSGSEVFADASDAIPIKFSFLNTNEKQPPLPEVPPPPKSTNASDQFESSPESYDRPKPKPRTAALRKNRSQSAQNLHKSEIKVFLQKAPSLEITNGAVIDNTRYDLPRKIHFSDDDDRVEKVRERSKSPIYQLQCKRSYNSIASGTSTPVLGHSPASTNNNDLSCRSRESVAFDSSSPEDDFDMKSASCQSLDPKSLFLSIDELNEITRQINESEEFNHAIDLEYCEHRDNLKPSERRITLLRNKNNRLINLDEPREKITNAWSGIKHWIGEEKDKFRVVMHKHAAMQRVGATAASSKNLVKNQQFFDEVNSRNTSKSTGGAADKSGNSGAGDYCASHASSVISVPQSMQLARSYQHKTDDTDGDVDELSMRSEQTSKHSDLLARNGSSIVSRPLTGNGMRVSEEVESTLDGKQKDVEFKEGQNGFEELRRYVKQGGDFGKDLVTILQERVESEQLYAKSLSKMASKLNKACREIPGSIADAWRGVATEMESRSEIHRQFSSSLVEEVVKPLKTILDNQHKTRKAIEGTVDKSSRILGEWRTSEAKAKKSSHAAARENEKLQDAMLDVRIQRSPSVALLNTHRSPDKEIKNAEKDCAKLDNKRRKAEESVKRADVEYYTYCIRAERARVDWEMSVLRGSSVLTSLENQRLTNMKTYVANYLKLAGNMNPVLDQLVERLTPQVNACNVQKDLNVVKNIRRASEGPSEQLLPDFYCEHTTLAMNRERRKQALVKLLQLVRTDLERERRSRNGLKGLSQSLTAADNQNITDKLYHIRSMLTYLEGARFKLQSALMDIDHKPRGSHPLAPHIQITRDRTGLQQSILKVPLWLKNGEEDNQEQPNCNGDIVLDEIENHIDDEEYQVDSTNEALIRSLVVHNNNNNNHSNSNSLTRSKSISELSNSTVVITQNGKSATLSDKSTADGIAFDRGIADGGSNQPDSDFDEFSSQDEDEDSSSRREQTQIKYPEASAAVISRCKALYNYTPKLHDELELNPGDLIDVHVKQDDGWWIGAIKSRIGIFPATYVEEITT